MISPLVESGTPMTAAIATALWLIKAFLVLRSDYSASDSLRDDIQQRGKKRLAAYEYPRQIEFVESLPMTTTGKIQRKVLREREIEKLKRK